MAKCKAPFRFKALPSEIRVMIYSEAIAVKPLELVSGEASFNRLKRFKDGTMKDIDTALCREQHHPFSKLRLVDRQICREVTAWYWSQARVVTGTAVISPEEAKSTATPCSYMYNLFVDNPWWKASRFALESIVRLDLDIMLRRLLCIQPHDFMLLIINSDESKYVLGARLDFELLYSLSISIPTDFPNMRFLRLGFKKRCWELSTVTQPFSASNMSEYQTHFVALAISNLLFCRRLERLSFTGDAAISDTTAAAVEQDADLKSHPRMRILRRGESGFDPANSETYTWAFDTSRLHELTDNVDDESKI